MRKKFYVGFSLAELEAILQAIASSYTDHPAIIQNALTRADEKLRIARGDYLANEPIRKVKP